MEQKTEKVTETQKNSEVKELKVWTLAGELGYTIAIPIVVLALLGRIADKFFGTSPWLLLAGILISIFASSWLIYRKVKEIL
jgi:ATP synthase protein I